jgi:hypothetical protein
MRFLIASVCVALFACGSGTSGPIAVELRGDSITQAAKGILADHLPNSKVTNLGLGGQKAGDMLAGTYGSMPNTRSYDTVYAFSFGANECIRNTPLAEYKKNIDAVVVAMKGYKTVLEAPWLITTDENGCNLKAPAFRQAVVDTVAKYSAYSDYRITMPALDYYQEPNGDIIHPGIEHLHKRAQLMAEAIDRAYR